MAGSLEPCTKIFLIFRQYRPHLRRHRQPPPSGPPLGFDISDKAVKRAGLDYWHLVEVTDYENLEDLFARHPEAAAHAWLTTTKAPRSYEEARFSGTAGCFSARKPPGLPLSFRERSGTGASASHLPGQEPESQQHRGGVRLRGPAAKWLPRPAGHR